MRLVARKDQRSCGLHWASSPTPKLSRLTACYDPPGSSIWAVMAIQIRTSLAEPDTAAAFVPHKPARPEKAEGGRKFTLVADYEPAGDQPTAIKELTEAALEGEKSQVLLGVTGSGKTFT